MAKRRVVAMVDPDPEWVSLVDKGAARKTFRVLKRDDGTSALIEGEAHRVTADAESPEDVGEVPLRKSMIAALKARVGVLRQLFDDADAVTPDSGDSGDAADDGSGAAIIGAVFDRTLFPTADAVKAWLDANQIVGDIETTADTFRVTCTALDSEISENDKVTSRPIGTQPFDAGVVLLVRKEAYEFPVTTSPDIVDGHVHRIESLNAYQDGWTKGAGTPLHIHRIIAGIVMDTTGAVRTAGETYASSHSGSVRSIAMTAETTKAAEGGNQGRQRMKNGNAAPDAPGADTATQKGLGDGPAGHVDFRSGITDVETSPGIFQAFDLMQRVLFNTLNDKDITEKAQHIADNLTEFSNFILGQVGKFSPEVVVEEQKHFAIKADPNADPKADPKAESGAPPDAGEGKGEVKSLMTELVVLLREALGKTAPGAPPPANGQAPPQQAATKTDKLDEVKELVEKIGERLGHVERGVVGRRGVSEVTNTPESVMAQKRARGESGFDNLFPWGHQDGENAEDY